MFDKAKAWVKKHKKGIAITVTIVSIVGTVAVVMIGGKKIKIPISVLAKKIVPENPENAKIVAKVAETVSVKVDGVVKTFPRSAFIRQLHEGWKASALKLKEAAEMGIELKAGETFVNACIVNMKVA